MSSVTEGHCNCEKVKVKYIGVAKTNEICYWYVSNIQNAFTSIAELISLLVMVADAPAVVSGGLSYSAQCDRLAHSDYQRVSR